MPARRTTGRQTDLYRHMGVGVQFAATIGVFAVVGHWIDGRLGTGPWLLIAGVFTGFGLGLVSLTSKLSPKKPPSGSNEPEQ